MILIMKVLNFCPSENFDKIGKKGNVCINVVCDENNFV